jgi:uncharacterized protein YlzI (FlbEa/FlbD family)
MQLAITVPIVKVVKDKITFTVNTEKIEDMFHQKDITQLISGNKLIAFVCAEEFLELDENVELADFETCLDDIKVELLADNNPHDLQQAMIP